MTNGTMTETALLASNGTYQMCVRCIMDTSDPDIRFDADGVCNHCHAYEEIARRYVRSGRDGELALGEAVSRIRSDGKGKPYDCIIGVSGGVDSTYVAYMTRELGLRPLAVHMDNGWDSELAVKNIENVLRGLGIDLYTYVLDWPEFRDLQVSFLRASVPDGEIPTDHAIGGLLYREAARRGIRHIISGSNVVTEGMLPASWVYGVADWRYIRGVQLRFGSRPLKKFPHYGLADLAWYSAVRRIRSFRILDYVPYVKDEVLKLLVDRLGWKYYGGKHYESVYTRFYQGYILPRKFNIDKRRSHLSTLIYSGQMTREQALAEIDNNPYTDALQREDREYVLKKLGLSENEFERIMRDDVRSYRDYPNSRTRRDRIMRVLRTSRLLPWTRSVMKSW